MITLEQAQQWTQKYSNVTIIHKGEHFRVDICDKMVHYYGESGTLKTAQG